MAMNSKHVSLYASMLVMAVIVLMSRAAYTGDLHIKAPEISGNTWLNSKPVRLSELHGRVVLVEFWTFGCRNCRHVEPYVKGWYRQFHDAGLEIVSIHSPEFGYERKVENVRQYINREGIVYPVLIDNDFVNWERFNNRFWPTLYLIDKDGKLRYRKIGEGDYRKTEQYISKLLQESG
jgi:thiol-disulfide isomerase/thioredoxin